MMPDTMLDMLKTLATSPIYGNVIGTVGLFATVIGLTFTYRAAKKSLSVGEQTKQGVADVRKDIRRIDTVNDLATAIENIEQIQRFHREQILPYLPDRYAVVREKLVAIKKDPYIPKTYQKALQSATTTITELSCDVEVLLETPGDEYRFASVNSILNSEVNSLREILVEIRNSIGENSDD